MKSTVPREQIIDANDVTSVIKLAAELNWIDIADLQSKVEMKKRDELLNKHPYKIWKDKYGTWHTYLPDQEKGRVHKKRKNEDAIKEVVIQYWKNQLDNPTVEDVYLEWIQDKVDRKEIEYQTKNRYDRQFYQCFGTFAKKRIKNVDEFQIEEFILNTIHEKELTQKGYSNLRTLVYGIFRRAKKKRYIDFSITEVVKDIEISRKSFRKNNKTEQELVFSETETEKVKEYIMNNSPDIISFGILLLFKTGLRPGELVALKWCDVENNIFYIHRTETRYIDENGKNVYRVRDFPKTDAGIRTVIIPQNAMWIIENIRKLNPFGEFVFERNGERLKEYNVSQRLETICKQTGIVRKSLNKIRKTYGTILIDSNVNDSVVISQMGHTDIKTTRKYYYKNRKSIEQKIDIINNVVGL